jgi:hypothetical protein
MALTKADMEGHRNAYDAIIHSAWAAERAGLYREVIESAISSWEHIDGMMQYERKYGAKDILNIEGIDLVLKYAPLLFDSESLDQLESLLQNQRRIVKNTSNDLRDKLAEARTTMWHAHRLWNHLEDDSGATHDEQDCVLGRNDGQSRGLIDAWEQMGIVLRTSKSGSNRLSLHIPTDTDTLAKCPSCAVVANATKGKFLKERTCPKCRTTVLFVFLRSEVTTTNTE